MSVHVKRLCIVFIAMCSFSYARAVILSIKSIEALDKYFEAQGFTGSDMVVFDVDMVLTMPQETAFQAPNLRRHSKDLSLFLKKLSPEERDLVLAYMIMGSPQIITHKKIVSLVSRIQEKNTMVLALTALLTGDLKKLPEPLKWRSDSLSLLGFDFQTEAENVITYTDYLPYLNGYPKKSGKLLVSNGDRGTVTKGMLLERYLNEESVIHLRLVMVDDRRKNLEEVASELQKHFPNLEFIGIHYVGAFVTSVETVSKEIFLKKLQMIYRQIKKK